MNNDGDFTVLTREYKVRVIRPGVPGVGYVASFDAEDWADHYAYLEAKKNKGHTYQVMGSTGGAWSSETLLRSYTFHPKGFPPTDEEARATVLQALTIGGGVLDTARHAVEEGLWENAQRFIDVAWAWIDEAERAVREKNR